MFEQLNENPNAPEGLWCIITDAYYTRAQRWHILLTPAGDIVAAKVKLTDLLQLAIEAGHRDLYFTDGEGGPTTLVHLRQPPPPGRTT